MKKKIKTILACLIVLTLLICWCWYKNVKDNASGETQRHLPESIENNDFSNYEPDNELFVEGQVEVLVPSTKLDEGRMPTKKYFEDGIRIDAVPESLDDFLACLAPLMLYETTSINLDMSNYPLENLDAIQEWPEDGDYVNYTISELFWPGSLFLEQEYDFIGEECIEYSRVSYGESGLDDELKVMQRCKELASQVSGSTNQEKMASIIGILHNIGTYEKHKSEPYDLLFNGSGNCMAFSGAVDCIARYLGIPCGEVSNDAMCHEWNIFIGSDDQIYEMDATNQINPGLLGTTKVSEYYGSMDYQETEIQLLNYDRRILELHGTVVPPPVDDVPTQVPTPTKEETPGETPEETPTQEKTVSDNTPIPIPSSTEQEQVTPTPSQQQETQPDNNSSQQTAPLIAPTEEPTNVTTGLSVPQIESITPGIGEMTVVVSGAIKYEVRYKRSNRNSWMSYTTTDSSFLTMGLRSGQTYYVQARSVQGSQYSDWTPVYQVIIE